MKRTMSLAAVVLGLSMATGAMAQTARQIDHHVAEMRKVMGLSGGQAGTIRRDLFAASDEKKQIRRNHLISPMDRQNRIADVNRSTREQIRAVLSPGQIQAWHNYEHWHDGF